MRRRRLFRAIVAAIARRIGARRARVEGPRVDPRELAESSLAATIDSLGLRIGGLAARQRHRVKRVLPIGHDWFVACTCGEWQCLIRGTAETSDVTRDVAFMHHDLHVADQVLALQGELAGRPLARGRN